MTATVSAPRPTTGVCVLAYSNERGPLGRFLLPIHQVITIGRALEAELRLHDGLTSRRHAQVCFDGEQLIVEDLESANGTFVNGQKIRRATLRPGDRVLIGVTHFDYTLEAGAPASPATTPLPAPANGAPLNSETTIVGTARLISGSLREIPLGDLLQLFSNMRKSGVLLVKNARDAAEIHLHEGRIHRATLNDSVAAQPERTLFRILRWTTGYFELRPHTGAPAPKDIDEATDSLLLESARQADELAGMESRLPRLDARLVIPENYGGELGELSPAQFDLLQLIHEHPTLLGVIDRFPGSDLDAFTALVALLDRGFVIAE